MKYFKNFLILFFLGIFFSNCTAQINKKAHSIDATKMNDQNTQQNLDSAIFGAGCFWCTEGQFQQLNGVVKVVSGFMGGHVLNPTYKEVCTGTTGHAEVCKIYFNPTVISYSALLAAFWESHDPTQLNKQGHDVGTQYRSVIFYQNENQKVEAEKYKSKLNTEKVFDGEVVTEIAPATIFYKAEDYHQNYFNDNGDQPYCQFVIKPKIEKFRKVFKTQLK